MRTTLLIAGLIAVSIVRSQTIELVPVASGFSNPVDIDNAGDERMFVVEKAGVIKILLPDGSIASQPFLDLTAQVSSTASEQGLLGMTFHPAYATNGYFYVNYIHGPGLGSTRISRFTVSADPDVADLTSELVIYTASQPGFNHNGGALEFGPDGFLWIPLGDGGPDHTSQDMTSPLGKVLRLDVDSAVPYAIPASNPYASADPTTVLPEIWASGLRNPFRFSFDALTGDVWIADVGENAYEEVNFWPAGDHSGPNFGWRCYEGPAPYNTTDCGPSSDYVQPIYAHPHSDGSCSVIGGYVYRGSLSPELYGKYIYTDFCHGRIHSLMADGQGGWISEEHTEAHGMGAASFGVDMHGELLLCNTITGVVSRLTTTAAPTLLLDLKVFLEGPLDANTGIMNDALRAAALLPLEEPYSAMGKVQLGGGGGELTNVTVLSSAGEDSVVDWIRLELRDPDAPEELVATRQALLLRNGNVVMPDGSSLPSFNVAPGEYYIVVDHRNHLQVITEVPIELSSDPAVLDLRSPSTPVYGIEARKTMGAWSALWAGDTVNDGLLKYAGSENDRDQILITIGGSSPTNMISGYHQADVNMDGVVKYTGADNDRDRVLTNIGGVIPTMVRAQQMP